MFGSFRARLIVTVIGLIALTAGAVAILAYVLVRDSLRDQLLADAVSRAEFNITVLASTDQLPRGAGKQEFEESGLVDRFLLRGTGGVYVEFPDGETSVSGLELFDVGSLVSPEVRDLVAAGEFGYQFLDVNGEPELLVAGRRPPDGPDFYFFYSAAEVANADTQLARMLVVAGLAVLVLGALAAGLIARRVLRPVAVAGRAANVMAAGDLSVRLPAETDDELGNLAVAFNRMATSLQDQINALVEAHDRERRFVADVSHELRTPLTALVNETAMLQHRIDGLREGERRIGTMLVADVSRLRALVEDLLEVSRLEAGSTPPETSDVDVGRFLQAVVDDRHPDARLVVPEPVGRVGTDRRSLERIVGNLLDNARNHAPHSPVTVIGHIDGELLTVDVSDEGPGVPESELPRLFDRFYKADASRQGGSGLGLAIARQHARRLGGDLTAELGTGGGLTFRLQIPVTVSLHPGDVAENSSLHPEDEKTGL
jgi:two-component system sensor histidine kinase MtrB